jgi:hypothetical protein
MESTTAALIPIFRHPKCPLTPSSFNARVPRYGTRVFVPVGSDLASRGVSHQRYLELIAMGRSTPSAVVVCPGANRSSVT